MYAVRRYRFYLILLALFLAGCSLVPAGTTPVAVTPKAGVQPTQPVAPATEMIPPSPTPVAPPTVTDAPTVEATATGVPDPTPSGADLSLAAANVFVHPVPQIYAGDTVSFYLLANVPEQIDVADVAVRVEVDGVLSAPGTLSGRNLAGQAYGLFPWIWETSSYLGDYQVTLTLDPDDTITIGDENPDNNQVQLTVSVLPARARPRAEVGRSWRTAETACCFIHYLSGTEAERDLRQLEATADGVVAEASQRLGVTSPEKLQLYLIDRVIGQGGYARSDVVVSYVDRNYAGGGLREVLLHETVHLLDRQIATGRTAFFAEGLAVWATGGHYKQEDIDQRAKALLVDTNLYVPLTTAIDDFYESQHEVGYLEAGAFVSYLVNTYGWERVRAFYGDAAPEDGKPDSVVIDESLQRHFGVSLTQAEGAWMAYLSALPRSAAAVSDVLTTVRYYNLMRQYQLQYDPTAHFLQAWLLFPQELQQRNLTAEVSRHPTAEINVTLELMLHAVDHAIAAGDYNRANVILNSAERALANNGQFIDPLGSSYQEIVAKLMALGYDVHTLELDGNQAYVEVTEGTRTSLQKVTMALKNSDWILLN